MAILLGCDFVPTGIPGVGKESVTQLFDLWPMEWDVMGAFKLWIKTRFAPYQGYSKTKNNKASASPIQCLQCDEAIDQHCQECKQWSCAVRTKDTCHCSMMMQDKLLVKLEEGIKKKCAAFTNDDFWTSTFDKVLAEFFVHQDIDAVKIRSPAVKCPSVDDFVRLSVKKLAWTEEYAVEKILHILSRWQVINYGNKNNILEAIRVVKKRVVSGTPSFDVEWKWIGPDSTHVPKTFQTCEPAIYLNKFCQSLIESFEASKKKPAKKTTTKTTRKKVTPSVIAPAPPPTPSKQPLIGQFFSQKKDSGAVPKKKSLAKKVDAKIDETIDDSDAENQLPDNLSFLIDDILSHNFKRNLSLCKQDEPDDVMTTSTPNNKGPRKKKITPSKVSSMFKFQHKYLPVVSSLDTTKEEPIAAAAAAEDIEDSFDRMCK